MQADCERNSINGERSTFPPVRDGDPAGPIMTPTRSRLHPLTLTGQQTRAPNADRHRADTLVESMLPKTRLGVLNLAGSATLAFVGFPATHIRAFSSGGERFPDTEEVTSSNLVTPTTNNEVRGLCSWPLCLRPPYTHHGAHPKCNEAYG